jgi:hypothetical protein
MRTLPLLLLLTSCAARDALLVCGRDRVAVVDVPSAREVWSWSAAEGPEEIRHPLRSLDECKAVEGGILVTSSGGAAALIDRASKRVIFHALVQNAHSAERLPDGRIVVAGSYGENGNRLVVFDPVPAAKPLWSDELYSAHGAVWDAKREVLWALGEKELRSYRRSGVGFERAETFALPDAGGHDLREVPGTSKLILTTAPSVWLFDRDAKTFATAPGFEGASHVKSVDIHPRTGRIACVKAETSHFADVVRLLSPPGEVRVPGAALYKARWIP